jgi:inhibitor of cysteine peptidase
MMRARTAALAASLALLLTASFAAGCGNKADGGGKGAEAADVKTNESREVSVGEEFTITLDSNPTTGYTWKMSTRPDESILGLTGDYFEAPQTDMVGAPGKHNFRFKALKEGKTSMVFIYWRSFEPDAPPAQSHTVSVTVR